MSGQRTEVDMRVILRRFRDQGGVVMESHDGHLKLYARDAYIGKLAKAGASTKEGNRRGLIGVRAAMRRYGFDV